MRKHVSTCNVFIPLRSLLSMYVHTLVCFHCCHVRLLRVALNINQLINQVNLSDDRRELGKT